MELSVIIPVYNVEKTLPFTLDSLFSQNCFPFEWEVVAVNDGSRDASLSVLRRYEKIAEEKNIPFRIFSYENAGVGVCRNRCLEMARGKFVLFLDADDRLEEGALFHLLTVRQEQNADILLFDSRYLYEDGSSFPFPSSEHPGGVMTVQDYMLSLPCPWNKIVKKEIFTQNDLSFKEGILYEDLALIPALGSKAEGKIYYEKKILHAYFQSPDSIMRAAWSEKRKDIFPALLELKKNAADHPLETEYLFWLHLYRNFVWLCFEENQFDAIQKANALMKENFPHWQKNPLIKERSSFKERFTSLLFYRENFFLLRLWKGGKK